VAEMDELLDSPHPDKDLKNAVVLSML